MIFIIKANVVDCDTEIIYFSLRIVLVIVIA